MHTRAGQALAVKCTMTTLSTPRSLTPGPHSDDPPNLSLTRRATVHGGCHPHHLPTPTRWILDSLPRGSGTPRWPTRQRRRPEASAVRSPHPTFSRSLCPAGPARPIPIATRPSFKPHPAAPAPLTSGPRRVGPTCHGDYGSRVDVSPLRWRRYIATGASRSLSHLRTRGLAGRERNVRERERGDRAAAPT